MRPPIPGNHLGKVTTVDLKTGKETVSSSGVFLMPAKPGTCEICAVPHDPTHPHNAQSMFYKYRFYNETGRWPTWVDAMSHCTEVMRAEWKAQLLRVGVNVDAGEVNPKKQPQAKGAKNG